MSKTILINAREADSPFGDTRVAIMDDGALTDFDIDSQWKEKNRGNIYCGVVTNVEPSLQAAFVDFGAKKQGFLPFSDVAPHAYKADHPGKVHTITEALKRKQRITVQILKEEMGNKGAALTTYVSLPGRYLVFMPNGDGAHISRKIEDEDERRRIKALAKSLDAPDDVGLIVRTAGMEQPKEVLARDLRYLSKVWADIDARVKSANGPRLVHRDSDTIIRTLRDYMTPDVTRIVVDTEQAYESAREFLEVSMPDQLDMLELHQGTRPLFSEYSVDSQVEGLFDRRAPLPSGGYLVIDQTEALVAIDVNSGRATKEGSQEETAYRTNLEAATEVARQLKLRDLGGIVVVDFIDMMKDSHNAEVEKRFREAIKTDKARFRISAISQHGLLEMTRQRIRPALMEGMMTACSHCEGRGKVRAVGAEGSRMVRAMADRLSVDMKPGFTGQLTLQAHSRVALHLLNERRDAVLALETAHHVRIRIDQNDALPPPHYALLLDREQSHAIEEAPRLQALVANNATTAAPNASTDPTKKRRRRRGGKGRGDNDGAEASLTPPPLPRVARDSDEAASPELLAPPEADMGAGFSEPAPARVSQGPRLGSQVGPRFASQVANAGEVPTPVAAAEQKELRASPRGAQAPKAPRPSKRQPRPSEHDEDAFAIAMVPMATTPIEIVNDDDIVDDEGAEEDGTEGASTDAAGAPKKRRRRRGGRGRKRSGRSTAAPVQAE